MKLFCYLKLLLYQITFKIEKNVDSWKKKKKTRNNNKPKINMNKGGLKKMKSLANVFKTCFYNAHACVAIETLQ